MEVLGAGKNPRAASVPIISEVEALPKGDQVVSFVFKLQYADPAELQQLLSQYFQSPGGTTAILALPKSGSIVAGPAAGAGVAGLAAALVPVAPPVIAIAALGAVATARVAPARYSAPAGTAMVSAPRMAAMSGFLITLGRFMAALRKVRGLAC